MQADTLPKLLIRNAEQIGGKVAMQEKTLGIWRQCTWRESCQRVKYLSLGLISLGLEHGDRSSILGDSKPEWYWAQFSIQAAGGVSVGLFTDALASELRYIIEHSGSKFVVAGDQEQVDKMLKIKDELPNLKRVIYWDPKGLWDYDDPILTSYEEVTELGRKYEEAHPGAFEATIAKGEGDDLAILCYTSATTGDLPKGVMLSHAGLVRGTERVVPVLGIGEDGAYFSVFPGAWLGEQVWGLGMHLVVGNRVCFAEEPETMLQNLREISPTVAPFSPRQLENLISTIQVKMTDAAPLKRLFYHLFSPVGYKLADVRLANKPQATFWKLLYALANLILFRPLKDKLGFAEQTKTIWSGGSALSPDAAKFFSAIGLSLRIGYAATEGSGFHCAHRGSDFRWDSVGPPLLGAEIRITDEGETLLGGGTALGYYKNPELTSKAFERGWFHTGDASLVTDDGHVVFIDRVSELGELASGYRYSPTYIEGKLKFSPYIKDAVSIGGKERDYLSAIINIDFENIGKWAEAHQIGYTTFVDLSQKKEVAAIIKKDIERINRVLPEPSRVRKYVLLHKEFDPDEAELTRTRKLRRKFFEERYHELIEAIYQGKEEVKVEASVKYRDGRTGVVTTGLRINSIEAG